MNKEHLEPIPELCECVCGGTAGIHKNEIGFFIRCERDPGIAPAMIFTKKKKAIQVWNEENKKMDFLTRCSVTAYHTGKSYGKYMAERLVDETEEVDVGKKAGSSIPELRCINCGMIIPIGCKSKKYCNEVCAKLFRDKQARIRKRLAAEFVFEEPEKEIRYCAMCGKEIPMESGRYHYCSGVCSARARRIQSRERNRERRKKQSGKKMSG